MLTAPPSGNRQSWAAATATSGSVGETATSGSTTVSRSQPGWVGTSWRVTVPERRTTGGPGATAVAAGAVAMPAATAVRSRTGMVNRRDRTVPPGSAAGWDDLDYCTGGHRQQEPDRRLDAARRGR